jgi:hypothetical protein
MQENKTARARMRVQRANRKRERRLQNRAGLRNAPGMRVLLPFTMMALVLPASIEARQCERVASVYSIRDPATNWLRSASLLGQAPLDMEVLRRASRPGAPCVGGGYPGRLRSAPRAHGVELVPATATLSINSAYPRDINNSALWAGKGLAAALSAGIRVRAGVFSAGLEPLVTYASNGRFPLAASVVASKFGTAWTHGIDLPQRFGDDALAQIDAGASFVRLDLKGFALGLSSENLWWGPQLHFPLLLSDAAAGFPHVFVGTSRPLDIYIGQLDGELIWGRLAESDFFDADAENDRRLFGGLIVGFAPRGLSGLMVGAARAFHQTEPENGFSLWERLRAPYTNVRTNFVGRDNSLFSLFLRWALLPAGFEFFAEWARDDHWVDRGDLLKEPDHSQAYALGFQKIAARPDTWYRVYGEIAHLQAALPYRGGRGVVSFYQNASVTQGHTQRGQLLGAWIGPGSDAQILGLDRVVPGRELGVYLLRVRYNEDAYYTHFGARYGRTGHDVELSLGARAVVQWQNLDLELHGSVSRRWNRALVNLQNDGPISAEWNLGLQMLLAWYPPWALRL